MAKWIYDKINSNYFLIGDVCLTNKEYQGKIGSLFFKCPLQKLAHLSVTERIFLWGPGHSAAHFFKSTMPTFSKELCSCFQKDYAQLPTLSKGLCQRFQKDSVRFFKRTLYDKSQISILRQHLNIQCLGVSKNPLEISST